MPSSQKWNSPGSKTSTSKPFPVTIAGTTANYTLKTEANIDSNKNITESKLTLQNSSGTSLATSVDGGKKWAPTTDSQGNPILNSNQIKALLPGGTLYLAAKNFAQSDAKSNDADPKQLNQLTNGNIDNTKVDSSTEPTGNLTGFGIEGETDQFKTKQAYGAWVYPTALKTNKQDYITFTMYEYGGNRNINISQTTAKGQGLIGPPNIIKTTLGSVVLPIQPSITDQNVVDWQGEGINPLQAIGASVSSELIETGQVSEATLKQLGAMGVSPNTMAYLRQWAAGKAVGVNLFARLSAAVVNPNLELLFSGPQLRPFNFSFRLSPRDLGEANNVKGIIRFFKQGMSVRRASDKLFLKAPNVFEIQYINGQTGKPHNSINKIKVCALTNCGVDYTPDGSYATFADPQSTMTSYGLNLQFSELEPIFNEDYGNPGETSIGY